MTLQQLIYFREIASTLHFTRAAENLFISQSSLSHAINTLERELGAPLFARQNGKKIILTQCGQEFLPYADQVIESLERGRERIRQLQDPMSGVVRVAYGYINGTPLVSRLFKQYYLDHPEKNISIQFQINDGSKKIEQMMFSGETDIAFIANRASSGLNCIPVAQQQLMVMLPAGHPLSVQASVSIQDITSEPIIAYHPGGNLVTHISELFAAHGYRPNYAEFVSGWTEEIAHIAMGRGIGILPRIPVNPTEICALPLEDAGSKRSLYLYWPQQPVLSPAAEFIRQYCISYFRDAGET